jgi:hypothetical protein
MTTTDELITTKEFTEALDAALASVPDNYWVSLKQRLGDSWGSKESVKTRLINQFDSLPDDFKVFDLEDIINVSIDEDSVGLHRFLSFPTGCGILEGTDLSNIDLRDVDLSYFTLTRVTLKGADLRGANLEYVDMIDTNLEGALLDGARLEMADLTGATGLVVDKNQKPKRTFGHGTAGTVATGTVTIDERTALPRDLLCCYFDPRLYQNDGTTTDFIENPTTFEDFVENFVKKYRYASDPIVTPPGSTLNLKVSCHMEAWVAMMLPNLQNAWNERETERETEREAVREAVRDDYNEDIDQFMASLRAEGGAQQG